MHRRLLAVPPIVALLLAALTAPAHAAGGGGGTSYTWIGSSQDPSADNHSWTDSRNWQPNGVPGDGDSVSIVAPDASHCTAHVDNVPTVALVGFSLAENPHLCSDSVSGGAITVTGTFSWNGGNLNSPTTIAAGANGTITGAAGRLNTLNQNLDLAGSLTLVGLAGTGTLRIVNPEVLHVLPGGTLTSSGTNEVNYSACCVNPARIVNDGTINVDTGDLEVHAVQIDQNATLHATGGGRLVSIGAPVTLGSGATYTGTGGWLIENVSTAVATGTQTFAPGFHLELGGLAVNAGSTMGGSATFAGTGTFDWTGGTVEGNLTFAHGFHVVASGANTQNGRRVLSGFDGTSGGVPATVTNHGSFTVGNGAVIGTSSRMHLVNASDGTLVLEPGTQLSSYSCCVNPDRIVNAGAVSVPTGSSTAPATLTNVAYQVTGGSTTIASGRQLLLTGGAPDSLTNTTVAGGGTLAVAQPSSVSGTVTIGTGTHLALQTHGSLDGTATIKGAGAFAWTGGELSGGLTVSPSGGIAVSGTDAKAIANVGGGSTPSKVTFTVPTTVGAGTAKASDTIDLGYSTLTLAASTRLANHTNLYGGTLINTGRLTVAPGSTGRADFGGPGHDVNRGTLALTGGTLGIGGDYTQRAGTTSLAAGSTLAMTYTTWSMTVAGGTLAGRGTVSGGVTNTAGTVSPAGTGVGTLHVAGAYTQGRKGTLRVDLASRSQDRLAVAGAVTLGGRLISHNAGTFRPALGAVRTVLTGQSVSGTFSCAISSGTGSSGTRAGHWAPRVAATRLAVVWRRSAATHC